MKKTLFISMVALVASCSKSQESPSSANASAANAQILKFESVDRCLTVPIDGDLTGRASMRLSRCGQEDRQTFLLKKDDIKATGHFGPYLTEKSGKIVAGSSSPWALKQNATGKLVVESKISNKCLVAGGTSLVTLGDCNSQAASVQILDASQLPERQSPRGAAGIVACGTDNQGNAESCI